MKKSYLQIKKKRYFMAPCKFFPFISAIARYFFLNYFSPLKNLFHSANFMRIHLFSGTFGASILACDILFLVSLASHNWQKIMWAFFVFSLLTLHPEKSNCGRDSWSKKSVEVDQKETNAEWFHVKSIALKFESFNWNVLIEHNHRFILLDLRWFFVI